MSHLFYITEFYQSKIKRKEECLFFFPPTREHLAGLDT